MLSIQFDSRGLVDAFKRYAEENRRDAAQLLEQQAQKLIYGVGKGGKGLFKEALSEASRVQGEISEAAARGPLKRPKGRSWQAEFAKRMKYAAVIQASGWLTRRYGAAAKLTGIRRVYSIENPPGQIATRLNGSEPFIQITNRQPGAGEFARKTGYIERAMETRKNDMLAYVNRKLEQRTLKL